MFQIALDEYSERAEECRLEARRSLKAAEKSAWLSLADEWLRLAGMTQSEMAVLEPLHLVRALGVRYTSSGL
jgi:hypothetical protein